MRREGLLTPMSPYAAEEDLASSGRISLARALMHYCVMHWGMDGDEVVAALGDVGEPDDGDRFRVMGAIRLFGRLFADGLVRTFARPFGGGIPVPLGAELWELDDFRPRFLHSALSLDAPWDPGAGLTHWIFVDADDWQELLDRSCADVAPPGWRRDRRKGKREEMPSEVAEEAAGPIPEALLRLPEVRRRTGLARSTIYAYMARGKFPRQADVDVAAWHEADVAEWIGSRR